MDCWVCEVAIAEGEQFYHEDDVQERYPLCQKCEAVDLQLLVLERMTEREQ